MFLVGFSTSGAGSSTAHVLAKAAILCIPGKVFYLIPSEPNKVINILSNVICSKWGRQGSEHSPFFWSWTSLNIFELSSIHAIISCSNGNPYQSLSTHEFRGKEIGAEAAKSSCRSFKGFYTTLKPLVACEDDPEIGTVVALRGGNHKTMSFGSKGTEFGQAIHEYHDYHRHGAIISSRQFL